MRLIKKPISLFLALIPLLIHGGILGKYYIESVVIDDEKNQWLQPQEKGWLAGDVGHSISIDRGKIVWLFGDSFIGEYKNGNQISDGIHINNCIAIQDLTKPESEQFTFHIGENEPTRAFFPPYKEMPGSFLWPTNGFYLNNSLFIFCQSMSIDGPGFWSMVGTVFIQIDNPHDNPTNWNKKYYDFGTLPWEGDSFQQQFHSAFYLNTDMIYFMGYTQIDGLKKSILSRISKEDFIHFKKADQLEYFIEIDGVSKWSNLKENLKFLFFPGNTESNIQYIKEWDIFITTTYTALDQNILLTMAKDLKGPWSEPIVIYKNPLVVCPLKTCIETYAVRPHPEFSTKPGELIISFVTSFQGPFEEISIQAYRPLFIKVQLGKND